MDGTVLDSGTVRLEFLRSDDEVHEMLATYAPGSPPPPAHLHPAQAERFEVRSGELLFVVDGVETTVRAGEAIDVAVGAVHTARNPGDVPAVALWRTTPGLRTGAFHVAVAEAQASGDVTKLLAVLGEYEDVFRLAP